MHQTPFAQLSLSALSPSPISIAITLGKWIFIEDKKVYYIQVESIGADKDLARNVGFQLATERAVGALVVSETEVSSNELIRKDFYKYSSGFIHDFKVISEKKEGDKVILLMDVWVAESAIADRILNKSNVSGKIDGARVAVQKETIINKNNSAENIMRTVLKDYPARAFNITVGKSTTRLVNTQVEITVPVEVAWSDNYLNALIDVIDKTKDGSNRISRGANGSQIGVISYRKKGGWIDYFASYQDFERLQIVRQYLIDSRPHLLLTFVGTNNQQLRSYCFEIPQLNGNYYGDAKMIIGKHNTDVPQGQFVAADTPYSHVGIYGDHEVATRLQIRDIQDPNMLKQLDTINVAVASKLECLGTDIKFDSRETGVIEWCKKNPGNGKMYCPIYAR